MKRFFLIGILAIAVAAMPLQSPTGFHKVTVKGPHGRLIAPRDTLNYVLRWGKATNATGYRVSVTASGSPLPSTTSGLPNNAVVLDTTISFSASNLTYDSLSFTATVFATRGNRTGATPATGSWFIVKLPGTPGPVKVDSSAVPPPLASLETSVTPNALVLGVSNSATACAYFKFSTGVVALQSADAPVCGTDYNSRYTALQRIVDPVTQAWVDTRCVQWSSGNSNIATVTSSACPVGSFVVFPRFASR